MDTTETHLMQITQLADQLHRMGLITEAGVQLLFLAHAKALDPDRASTFSAIGHPDNRALIDTLYAQLQRDQKS
jgi:hypothetical protein